MLGLCRLQLAGRKNKEAAHRALDVIALQYHSPLAHFYLGCALHRLGKISNAIQSLELAVQQNPNIPEVYHRLSYIYKNRLQMEERAEEYKRMAKEAVMRIGQLKKGVLPRLPGEDKSVAPVLTIQSHEKERQKQSSLDLAELERTVVLVSGLPRSGTSMLMQMLEAGGFPVLTDNRRVADENNPRGYYEYEKVKSLARDNRWLVNRGGTAVKIIAQLIPFLPRSEAIRYRILFVERDLDEVLLSQEKMLTDGNEEKVRFSNRLIKNGFFRQVENVKALILSREIPVLYLQYRDCISQSSAVAGMVNYFLGGQLNETAMANVVDAGLYRNKMKDAWG